MTCQKNAFLIALALCPSLFAATFTVSANADFRIAGQNLQAAINSALPGDTVLVDPAGSYLGPITLPFKSGSYSTYITIRTLTPDSGLPAAGVRISPSYSSAMPKILGAGGYPAIQTAPYAHHYQLIGIEFLPASPTETVYQIVQLGDAGPNQTTLAQVPHHLTFDRCYIHAYPNVDFKAGILLNSASTDIVNSYISELHSQTQDTQALGGYNGPGPYNIINNYLESSGINVMFGGAPPTIPNLVPSNIRIARNDFNKQLSWKNWDKVDAATYAYYQANYPTRLVSYGGRLIPNFIIHTPGAYTPIIKNLFEIKNGQDITLDGNTFSNNWVQADEFGTAFELTPRTESGAVPWATVQRVTFSNNVIRHVGGLVNIGNLDTGQTGPATNHVTFSNNLVDDIRQDYAWDYERVIQFTGIDHLTFDHNTYLHNSFILLAWGTQSSNFVYTNNIVSYGNGLDGDCGYYLATLCQFTGSPAYVISGNAVIGGSLSTFPAGNFFPATNNDVGFVNVANLQADYHNYGLAATSLYKGKATDGTDPGFSPANFDAARGGVPTADSVTPSAGSGSSQVFHATYSDTAGWSDLYYTELIVNSNLSGVNACWVYYFPSSNALYLYNDSASAVAGPLAAGSAGTLQNSQCTLDAGASSASGSGNSLTLNLALTFKSSFVGAKNVYMTAFNNTANSGWQTRGAWTVTNTASAPPSAVSISPASGTGSAQTFQASYSDAAGAGNIAWLELLVNNVLSGVNGCWVLYNRGGNAFYMYSDNATALLGPITPGVAGTLQNSQCTLDGAASSVTAAGNNLTWNAAITFKPAFAGAKNTYLYAIDNFSLNSGWQTRGAWTVAVGPPPTADSVNPASGSGLSRTFQATYSDAAGAANIATTQFLVNNVLSGANACWIYYYRASNVVYLYNDATAAFLGPLPVGVAGTLQNSQCTLDAGASSFSVAGNSLTVNLAISFKAAFGGPKTTYMNATDSGNQSSGWQARGVWTVQ